MKLIDKILLAHDFGESSENVVAAAIELARLFHAEILPIHVLPDDITHEKANTLLKKTATQKLQETVRQITGQGVKARDFLLRFGSPYQTIVTTAVDVNASMILIGAGEKRKGNKFLLGTTAERIIQNSDKPVFVVKDDEPLKVHHILCPVDFSATSKRALKNAVTMARRCKARLTVLSVCELPGFSWFQGEQDLEKDYADQRREHQKRFDRFLADFNFSDLNWAQLALQGNPAEEILEAITGNGFDFLVIGTTGKSNLSRWIIGSVTEKVVREVPCSFLTLKSEDIVTPHLEMNIQDLESHYHAAMQLMEDGYFEESIEQFKLCLGLNSMHVPSHFGIAKVYEKMNRPQDAKIYRGYGEEIMNRIWNQKIEAEVRKMMSH